MLVFSMKLSSLLCQTLCVACLCGVMPLFAFPEPDAKSSADKTQADTSKPDDKAKDAKAKDDKAKTEEKADQPGKNKPAAPGKGNPNKNAKNAEMAIDREQAALDFAGQHHPELVALISPLKTSNPREYQRAIKELLKTSDRLLGIRQRDSARYELELDAWKLQSQVRLLAARLTMVADPELESQLRDTLKKKTENQLKLLQNERTSLQTRLDQVQKQIDRTSSAQDQIVQQEFDRLTKENQARTRKPARDKDPIVPKANPGKPVTNKKTNASKTSSTTSAGK